MLSASKDASGMTPAPHCSGDQKRAFYFTKHGAFHLRQRIHSTVSEFHPESSSESAIVGSGALQAHVLLQCFVVSTLVSMMPANPFIFRNYELPPKDVEAAQQVDVLIVASATWCASASSVLPIILVYA